MDGWSCVRVCAGDVALLLISQALRVNDMSCMTLEALIVPHLDIKPVAIRPKEISSLTRNILQSTSMSANIESRDKESVYEAHVGRMPSPRRQGER